MAGGSAGGNMLFCGNAADQRCSADHFCAADADAYCRYRCGTTDHSHHSAANGGGKPGQRHDAAGQPAEPVSLFPFRHGTGRIPTGDGTGGRAFFGIVGRGSAVPAPKAVGCGEYSSKPPRSAGTAAVERAVPYVPTGGAAAAALRHCAGAGGADGAADRPHPAAKSGLQPAADLLVFLYFCGKYEGAARGE